MENDVILLNRSARNALSLSRTPTASLQELRFESFILETNLHFIKTRIENPMFDTEYGPAIGVDGLHAYLLTLTYVETAKAQIDFQIAKREELRRASEQRSAA